MQKWGEEKTWGGGEPTTTKTWFSWVTSLVMYCVKCHIMYDTEDICCLYFSLTEEWEGWANQASERSAYRANRSGPKQLCHLLDPNTVTLMGCRYRKVKENGTIDLQLWVDTRNMLLYIRNVWDLVYHSIVLMSKSNDWWCHFLLHSQYYVIVTVCDRPTILEA